MQRAAFFGPAGKDRDEFCVAELGDKLFGLFLALVLLRKRRKGVFKMRNEFGLNILAHAPPIPHLFYDQPDILRSNLRQTSEQFFTIISLGEF